MCSRSEDVTAESRADLQQTAKEMCEDEDSSICTQRIIIKNTFLQLVDGPTRLTRSQSDSSLATLRQSSTTSVEVEGAEYPCDLDSLDFTNAASTNSTNSQQWTDEAEVQSAAAPDDSPVGGTASNEVRSWADESFSVEASEEGWQNAGYPHSTSGSTCSSIPDLSSIVWQGPPPAGDEVPEKVQEVEIDPLAMAGWTRYPRALRRCNHGTGMAPACDDMTNLMSVGSEQHHEGTCKPCLFVNTKVGCVNGTSCQFCHLPHEKKNRTRPCKARRMQCKQVVAMLEKILGPGTDQFNVASEKLARESSYMRSILRNEAPKTSLAHGAAGSGNGARGRPRQHRPQHRGA